MTYTPIPVVSTPAEVPIGAILLWSGAIAAIPVGYAMCDGTSGTPDLRDRFLIGAGSTHAVGDTGGSTTTSAVSAGTPAGSNSAPTFTGSALSTHTHTFTGSALAGHSHAFAGDGALEKPADTALMGDTVAVEVPYTPTGTISSVSAGTPAGTNSSVSAGTPSGTVSAPTFTGSALGTHTHTLTPVFYALAYIQRIL